MSKFVVILCCLVITCLGQPCTFTDNRGSGLQLDLRGLQDTIVYGYTSAFNYSYTPCNNNLECQYGPQKDIKSMALQRNANECNYLVQMADIQPYWDGYVNQWTFNGFGNGGPNTCDFRINLICNKSVSSYNTLFFGAMAGCVYGLTIETQYACPVNNTETYSNNIFRNDIIDDNIYVTECDTDEDCSFNGDCVNKICQCYPAWKGNHCAQLNILPTNKTSGYQNFEGGMNVSSWGGSVILGKDGKYHMYAAEMASWCGINAWRPNSILIHAISDTPTGKYTKTDEIALVWTHEPTACNGPNGEYIVYAVHSPYPDGGNPDISPCNKDNTGACMNGATLDCDYQLTTGPPNVKTYTQMKYTNISNGSTGYSEWTIIPTQNPDGMDSCLACYIFKNGSIVALFEGDFDNGQDMWIEYGSNWKDNNTYQFHHAKIPDGLIIEDPYIWYDKNGILHGIFHNDGWDTPFGYHAFSLDNGRIWKGYDQSITAYDDLTYYENGETAQFTRCERPHIIMDKDGYTPIALSNAVVLSGIYLDYSYTLIRPINTDKNNDIKYKTRDFTKAKPNEYPKKK